ncbi:MAG TPA: hypothetical protein VNA24_03895 [Hyalangium sp.]|jgi:hypothetical protein|nr:hypothetical protein [Hyalangium sp.]
MQPPLMPPLSRLPQGATSWATVEDVAIRTRKEVRTIKHWCALGLFFVEVLAGGYGGTWVAVDADTWPLTNAAGAKLYREARSASSRVGARASVESRRSKKPARRSSSPRRSA